MKIGSFFLKAALILSLSISCIIFTACGGSSYFEDQSAKEVFDSERTSSAEQKDDQDEKEKEKAEEKIFVEVSGAVKSPGVFEVEPGTRVFSCIGLSGGLLPDADIKSLNQAALVNDGQKIYVPREGELLSSPSNDSAGDGLININTADEKTLMSLPGVGEAKAKSIVSFRSEKGPFKETKDIMKISGIKSGLYEKIKGLITV